MTTNNGWPGKLGVPLNPERDGWHWLQGAASLSKPRPYLWEVFLGSGRWADERLDDSVILAEMEYIRPALPHGLTSDETTALQARVAELEGAQTRLILSFRLNILRLNPKLSHETISKAIDAALEGKKDE